MAFSRITLLLGFCFILLVVSCSGPQMIEPPEGLTSSTPTPTPTPVKKLKAVVNESKAVETQNDDQAIFDDTVHQLSTNLSLWKMISDEEGVKTYEKMEKNSGLVSFRGEIIIPAPLKKVATILSDRSLQPEWVDSYVEGKLVSQTSDYEHIEYNQTKVPWPFQNRDFLFSVIVKANVKPPTMLIMMKSIENTSVPPVEGIVRGEIKYSYYYLKELSSVRATKMVVEMEVDPKGTIPLWLVNLSQKAWPKNTLLAIKRLSMRENIPILPKLEQYFEEPKVEIKTKKRKNK